MTNSRTHYTSAMHVRTVTIDSDAAVGTNEYQDAVARSAREQKTAEQSELATILVKAADAQTNSIDR
jgi:hypothetical protein